MKPLLIHIDASDACRYEVQEKLIDMEHLELLQFGTVAQALDSIENLGKVEVAIAPGEGDGIQAKRFIEKLKSANPSAHTFVYDSPSEFESLRALMEAGVDYFLPENYIQADFFDTLKSEDQMASMLRNPGWDERMPTVLFVDDDEAVQTVVIEVLRSAGFHVDGLMDPLQSISQVEKRQYDILLVDYNMPGLNGADFIRAVKLKNPGLFAVGITAFFTREVVDEMMDAGAYTVIKKPFQVKHLQRAMKKFLILSEEHAKSEAEKSKMIHRMIDARHRRTFVVTIPVVLILTALSIFLLDKGMSQRDKVMDPTRQEEKPPVVDLLEEVNSSLKDLSETEREQLRRMGK